VRHWTSTHRDQDLTRSARFRRDQRNRNRHDRRGQGQGRDGDGRTRKRVPGQVILADDVEARMLGVNVLRALAALVPAMGGRSRDRLHGRATQRRSLRPVGRLARTRRRELRQPAFEEAPFGTVVGELPRTSVGVTRLIHPPEAS
jgi:hypothetical protein